MSFLCHCHYSVKPALQTWALQTLVAAKYLNLARFAYFKQPLTQKHSAPDQKLNSTTWITGMWPAWISPIYQVSPQSLHAPPPPIYPRSQWKCQLPDAVSDNMKPEQILWLQNPLTWACEYKASKIWLPQARGLASFITVSKLHLRRSWWPGLTQLGRLTFILQYQWKIKHPDNTEY